MKKVLGTILTLSLILFGAGMASAVSFSYGGHLYEVVEAGTWSQTEAAAVALGGHLVTINDADEQAWLVSTFGASPYYWIGFNDFETEGSWVWSSGEAVTYTWWNSGEPNNSGNEDAAVMNWGSAGRWNDWADSHVVLGIAEYAAPVPVPAAVWLLGSGLLGLAGLRRKIFK